MNNDIDMLKLNQASVSVSNLAHEWGYFDI